MGVIEKFFEAKQELCDYFGYVEDWKDIPFRDHTEDEWVLTQNADGKGRVSYGPKINFETLNAGDNIYNSMYSRISLP